MEVTVARHGGPGAAICNIARFLAGMRHQAFDDEDARRPPQQLVELAARFRRGKVRGVVLDGERQRHDQLMAALQPDACHQPVGALGQRRQHGDRTGEAFLQAGERLADKRLDRGRRVHLDVAMAGDADAQRQFRGGHAKLLLTGKDVTCGR